MDREKIIKALECCANNDCTQCHYHKQEDECVDLLAYNTLSLIKELAEDNEYLKTALTACEARYDSRKESDLEEVLELRLKVDELTEENEGLRADKGYAQGVRDFAERVKNYYRHMTSKALPATVEYYIDQIEKEMLNDAE